MFAVSPTQTDPAPFGCTSAPAFAHHPPLPGCTQLCKVAKGNRILLQPLES